MDEAYSRSLDRDEENFLLINIFIHPNNGASQRLIKTSRKFLLRWLSTNGQVSLLLVGWTLHEVFPFVLTLIIRYLHLGEGPSAVVTVESCSSKQDYGKRWRGSLRNQWERRRSWIGHSFRPFNLNQIFYERFSSLFAFKGAFTSVPNYVDVFMQ